MTDVAKDTLSAQEFPLRDILSDHYVFSIPDFQRPYSWQPSNARELLDDLTDAMTDAAAQRDTASPYFLGSIVLIKAKNDPRAQVVDGQQRLTTLTLLLSAIRSLLKTPGAKEGITKRIYEQQDEIAGTHARYRLSLRTHDQAFFRKYVQHEDGIAALKDLNDSLDEPQDLLRSNARLFLEALSQRDEEALKALAVYIVTRCFLVVVSTPDFGSAYRIFGVLNSRGLDLTATDILKSSILGEIPDVVRGLYTTTWEDLERDLGRTGFGDLFSHIRMVYRKSKPQGTMLKEFQEHVPTNPPAEFMDTILKPMSKAFREIEDQAVSNQTHADATDRTLAWLNLIEFKDWLPPALAFFVRHHNDGAATLAFFNDMERLAYSMLIRRVGVNERIVRFSEMTGWVQDGKDLTAPDSPLQLSPHEQHYTYQALTGPLYGTHSSRAMAVLLLRLDGLLSSGGAIYQHDIITVEHVLPQNPSADSEWLTTIPDEADRLFWVNRLGNLALLCRKKNSSASNFDFEKKKKTYFSKNGVSPFTLTTQVLANLAWSVPVMAARQVQLLKTLETHWRLEGRKDPFTASA